MPDPAARLDSRVTELEILFTHLQRQVAELHQVMLAQDQRLQSQARQLAALAGASPSDASENGADEQPEP